MLHMWHMATSVLLFIRWTCQVTGDSTQMPGLAEQAQLAFIDMIP
jgi:hypothetical protein